jgi:hypothetical protein
MRCSLIRRDGTGTGVKQGEQGGQGEDLFHSFPLGVIHKRNGDRKIAVLQPISPPETLKKFPIPEGKAPIGPESKDPRMDMRGPVVK